MGVVALALISIAIGRWSEAPKPDKPKVKPRSEMEETAARLQEAKALLAKLEKNPPRTSKPRVEHSKVQSGRDIVLSLPPGKVGQFLNANTKSRLCPQMVMSCRVPRNLNVEVRAPNHTPRVFLSHELKAHPTELKSFRLRKRAPKKNKK